MKDYLTKMKINISPVLTTCCFSASEMFFSSANSLVSDYVELQIITKTKICSAVSSVTKTNSCLPPSSRVSEGVSRW